jgi:hypothetical protein
VFDVTKFGAKGDGTTDDYDAVLKAAAACAAAGGGTLLFPAIPKQAALLADHANSPDSPPCAKRPTHTEDVTFTQLARQLGCEMSESQRAARVEALKEQFGTAFDGNAIRVAVQKQSATVVILVPAPPLPTIGAVKAILRSDHPHFAGRHVQLGAAPVRPLHPVVPFDDSLPLGQLRPFEKRKKLHPAQLTEDGALSIFVLESNIRDERSGTAARGSDWVKVPLHPGDSLAKLSLLHNLDVATLKAANNIIGSEIEGWRDDLWLPPLAALRPAPKAGKVDYVARFRIALRAKSGAAAARLPSSALPLFGLADLLL